jgi:hypothetical protein
MPNRLRQIILSSAVQVLEHSMVIEQQPALSTWSWYVGALHQYHTGLLLLNELYAGHNEPEVEARVWKCLDFAFGITTEGSYVEKTRFVLEDLISKIKIYTSLKRIRAPSNMPHAGPRTHTPGYQARQQEKRERSGSLQSTRSGSEASGLGSPLVQQTSPPPHLYRHTTPKGLPSFPGAMPNVDWGSIELPASASTFSQSQSTSALYSFNDFPASGVVNGSEIPTMSFYPDQQQRSVSNSPAAAIYGGMRPEMAGGSPMDALNEMDWVSCKRVKESTQLTVCRTILRKCLQALRLDLEC